MTLVGARRAQLFTELAAVEGIAARLGIGAEWSRMLTERTFEAAYDARMAARRVNGSLHDIAESASYAIRDGYLSDAMYVTTTVNDLLVEDGR